MSMSWQETFIVNTPFRDWFLRGEIAAFKRMADAPPNGQVLDMGCGRGTSARLILEMFRPEKVVAFDLDPRQVERARRRLGPVLGERIDLRVADATHMPFADGEFDAAFEVGTLHHIPDWRAALREIGRVLKAGGLFYFAEPSEGRIHRGLYRCMGHRKDAGFSGEELRAALREAGLAFDGGFRRLPLWDLVGVARKASAGYAI